MFLFLPNTGHLQRTYDQLKNGDLSFAGGDDFFRKCFVFAGFEEKFLNVTTGGSKACSYDTYQQQLTIVNQV
jgi:hypothetical protein